MRVLTCMRVVAKLKILAGRAKIRLFRSLTDTQVARQQLSTKLHQMRVDFESIRYTVPIRVRQNRIVLHIQIGNLTAWAQIVFYMCVHALHVDTAMRLHKTRGLDWRSCHQIARFCRDYINDLPVLPVDVAYAVARCRRDVLLNTGAFL